MSTARKLQTERLDLEPVRTAHASEAWPHLDDERMWRYFEAQRPRTPDALRRLYEKWERGSPDAGEIWLNWVCRERLRRALVGSVQATVFSADRVSYVAYAIYPEYRRAGYAREATRAVVDYVRRRHGIDRFIAQMDKRNEASYRLAESLGFVRVETGAAEYVYELSC